MAEGGLSASDLRFVMHDTIRSVYEFLETCNHYVHLAESQGWDESCEHGWATGTELTVGFPEEEVQILPGGGRFPSCNVDMISRMLMTLEAGSYWCRDILSENDPGRNSGKTISVNGIFGASVCDAATRWTEEILKTASDCIFAIEDPNVAPAMRREDRNTFFHVDSVFPAMREVVSTFIVDCPAIRQTSLIAMVNAEIDAAESARATQSLWPPSAPDEATRNMIKKLLPELQGQQATVVGLLLQRHCRLTKDDISTDEDLRSWSTSLSVDESFKSVRREVNKKFKAAGIPAKIGVHNASGVKLEKSGEDSP